MPKLQQIKRTNGSLVHSVNIPLEHIELSRWVKGDELKTETKEISKGVFVLLVSKEEK